jgi:hypothetical protein
VLLPVRPFLQDLDFSGVGTMKQIAWETHRAEFIRLAMLLRSRIERSIGPHWWEESEAENLTHQLEDARQRLGTIPGINCEFAESPAFLVAKSTTTYLGTHLARSYGVHELVERLPWCYSVTLAVWSDPLIDGSHSRQCLHAIIDEKAHAESAAEQGYEPSPEGPTFLLSEGAECSYVGPNEYRSGDEAKAAAIEVLCRWIDAIELATTPKPTAAKAFTKVTLEDVAKALGDVQREISAKTLSNEYKKEWGKPAGKKSNADVWNWKDIRLIIEKQFNVELPD